MKINPGYLASLYCLLGAGIVLSLAGMPATYEIEPPVMQSSRVRSQLAEDEIFAQISVPEHIQQLVEKRTQELVRLHRTKLDAAGLVKIYGRPMSFEGLFRSVAKEPALSRNILKSELGLDFSSELCNGESQNRREVAYELIRRTADEEFIKQYATTAFPDDPAELREELLQATLRGIAAVCLAEFVRARSVPPVKAVG